ncbi:MAG: phosphoribosylanthranilate isomerase [Pirellulales bacterium]|nr:phosphoribosylanthranilate isomerase [Pirellulales bacterium]
MFRIKICGVTSAKDAIAAFHYGADAIGLNFFPQSPRFVTGEQSLNISLIASNSLRERNEPQAKICCIGVFVNHTFDEIGEVNRLGHLSAIQLHGDEPPEMLARFPKPIISPLPSTKWSVIRARRFGPLGVAGICEDLDACKTAGRRPDAVLVDALTPGRYGGTGETVSWAGLADHRRWLGDTPLILAGGLTPDNVAEAIRIVRPYGIDVASGVESSPGRKDPYKVRDFVAAARGAFGG